MNAFKSNLKLIKLTNDNYGHIGDLETLSNLYVLAKESDYNKEYPNQWNLTQEQITKLGLITKTTHNSHYNYNLFASKELQDPLNHVDIVLEEFKQ